MTFPSFQPIQQKQQAALPKSPLVLKQGQIFYGSVKQLYLNQLAEIQIGEHRLMAKLETPLKAGDSHFFQVTSVNPQAELKVVSGPMEKSPINVQQLMESLNLPKSQEMQELLAHYIKHQLPISKELLQAESWLKNLPKGISKREALQALQKLVELKIPFTEEAFKALLFGAKTSGISETLNQFAQLLRQTDQLAPQLKGALLNTIQSISNPFEAETAGLVIARSVQTLLHEGQGAASSSKAIDLSSEGEMLKNGALAILKEAKLMPEEATAKNWLDLVKVSSREGTAGSFLLKLQSSSREQATQIMQQMAKWVENEDALSSQQKNAILQLLQSFEGKEGSQLAKRLHEELLKAFSEQTINRLFINENGISPKEHLLSLLKQDAGNLERELTHIAKILQNSSKQAAKAFLEESEALALSRLNGQGLQKAIHSIVRSLGLSYEAALKNNAEIENIIQSLKPQLISLIQDENVPSELKNGADALLARLNGMQLLSGEAGHQHQIIMQLPLQFFGKQVDATVQWNGRMKKDGKIDSNYARILFYLTMEGLKETVVDMQVQNRIVSICVYNEQEGLDVLAEPLKKALKAGLEERNYHLSGVVFKSYRMEKLNKGAVSQKAKREKDIGMLQKRVDIRI